jgi:hypothetical protein
MPCFGDCLLMYGRIRQDKIVLSYPSVNSKFNFLHIVRNRTFFRWVRRADVFVHGSVDRVG